VDWHLLCAGDTKNKSRNANKKARGIYPAPTTILLPNYKSGTLRFSTSYCSSASNAPRATQAMGASAM
jgi:hypothetical protein